MLNDGMEKINHIFMEIGNGIMLGRLEDTFKFFNIFLIIRNVNDQKLLHIFMEYLKNWGGAR
jgi:hypothetical protein